MTPLTPAKIFFIVYALFLFAGAFMGLKAGSRISLIMGLASGCLVLLGVYFMGLNPRNGYLFLSILNGLLTVVFLMRFLKTHSMMPSGMLLIVSLIVLIFCFIGLSKS